MLVSWFSAGCSSFLATYLMREQLDHCVYIDIADQHPDSMRFIMDAERLLGISIEVIRCEEYANVEDVIRRKRFINSPHGAPCTMLLKRSVRELWEKRHGISSNDTYVWGYDAKESARAERLAARMHYVNHIFPLVEGGLTKQDAHAACEDLGLKRPVMYDLGFPNNNCIGCVKGGKGYWNKVRRIFPDVFERRAALEREIGHSCINGTFLDELEVSAGRCDQITPERSIMCQLALDR